MTYVPVGFFVLAVLAWWASNRSTDASSFPAIYAGYVGLVSAILSAYLVLDRSEKGVADVGRFAAILLVAHGVLFVLLLLKKDSSSRNAG